VPETYLLDIARPTQHLFINNEISQTESRFIRCLFGKSGS
jgi:hypothetical protein